MDVVWTFDLVDGPKPKAIYNGKVKSKLAALQNSSVMWQSEIIGIEWIRSPHGGAWALWDYEDL
jgi:hypothetical protein